MNIDELLDTMFPPAQWTEEKLKAHKYGSVIVGVTIQNKRAEVGKIFKSWGAPADIAARLAKMKDMADHYGMTPATFSEKVKLELSLGQSPEGLSRFFPSRQVLQNQSPSDVQQ